MDISQEPMKGENPFASDGGQQPRLGIAHLMLWTVCVAITLSLYKLAYKIDPLIDEQSIFSIFRWICYSILQGAAIASLAIFVYRRWSGIRFPTEAGHCLLLIYGVVALCNLILWAIMQALVEEDSNMYMVHTLVAIMFWVVTALLHALTAWKLPVSMNWKLMLVALTVEDLAMLMLMALIYLVPFMVGSIFNEVYTGLNLVEIIILSFVIGTDIRRRIRRDWLHWTGVALLYCSAVMAFISYFYYLFLNF